MLVLDYGYSFICHPGPANAVRFWVESRTILVDEQRGTQQVFYQCGSCKSEDTFAAKQLFLDPNYDFLPILGPGGAIIFRRMAHLNDNYIQVRGRAEPWGDPIPCLRERVGQELPDYAAQRAATVSGLPLVAQTEIHDAGTGLRAIIEYPVKTMNLSDARGLMQVDTGPIALPDLSQRHEPAIAGLRLAFVAFNAPDFADFIVEQATPLPAGKGAPAQVYHYSGLSSRPAKNRLYALPRL